MRKLKAAVSHLLYKSKKSNDAAAEQCGAALQQSLHAGPEPSASLSSESAITALLPAVEAANAAASISASFHTVLRLPPGALSELLLLIVGLSQACRD